MADPVSVTGLSAQSLARILDVTRQLAEPFDLQILLGQIVDAGREVLRADRGTIFLYDAKTDELVSTVATGSGTLRFPADRGIVGQSARSRQVINVPDCYVDSRFNREVDLRTGYRTRCSLTVPLIGYDHSLVGVLQVLNKQEGVFTEEDQAIATALAAQCAVAIQRMRMLGDLVAKEKMERELAVARDIQMRVLPAVMPRVPAYALAGWCRPADQTGGDIFDVIALDGERLVLLLGDATGHGIGPALSVTQVRSMLRIGVRLGADLDAAFTHINDQLAQDLADNRFVTAFLGVLDSRSHTVTYHAGGQGPTMWFHGGTGRCDWLKASTLPLGMMAGLPLKKPQVCALQPGDVLGLITDGVFEYEDASGEAFGQVRIEELVRRHHQEPMARLVEILFQGVDAFADSAPQLDDMTMLLVRRTT